MFIKGVIAYYGPTLNSDPLKTSRCIIPNAVSFTFYVMLSYILQARILLYVVINS